LLEIWKKVDITIIFITHDLDEAIFLADRILVLSAHPGQVQELIEVPLERPRRAEHFDSAEFRAMKARLEELIHPPAAETEEEAYPAVPLFTDVRDSVE
jgi:NitT/TauT family transport system ATP-binding protein